ncbi:amidohydrolase [Leucobacter sp. M11]|uniref:amidohydrolase n=1 Tax=Leucobacter sp. M11 TaxID=2993565 RepID=UPI002D7F31A9|nr:amidohydrolase [Leucobacter sp. M11]MEB4613800.1 amidohydrolase [Leucobacter sp. M11]
MVKQSAPDAAALREQAARTVAAHAEDLLALSHRISQHPELGLQETQASRWLTDAAAQVPGARATLGVGGLETAFLAQAGTGELVLTVCAEYDALPEVGHGCGHNVIATAGLGAFLALAPLADQLGATIRLIGTPAEENEGGKITLLDAGVFDGTHAALMVHPGPSDEVSMNPFASGGISARFLGREAHASLTPHRGINALDALTVTLTAIGLARQQLEPGQQIHGSIAERGGAPNVIPGSSAAVWMVRATSMESLDRVTEVVTRCIRAGALAAGCTVEIEAERDGRYANMRIDADLTEAYRRNATALGRSPLAVGANGGSTDMGNVSQRFPSIHPMIGLGDAGLTLHTADFAARAAGPAGDAAVLDGATLLAQTAIDLATDRKIRSRLLSDTPFGELD